MKCLSVSSPSFFSLPARGKHGTSELEYPILRHHPMDGEAEAQRGGLMGS